MGLTMNERNALVRETAKRYQQAGKKEKGRILNEFAEVTGYNRKYAIHAFANEGKVTWKHQPGQPVGVRMLAANRGEKGQEAGRKRVYDESVRNSILRIWRYFAQALGHEACTQGFKVRFASTPIVLDELVIAEQNELSSIWNHYLQVDLLILDDFCLHPVTTHQATLLWKLVAAVHHGSAMIICSQGTASWHAQLGGDAAAEAIIDRIVHNSVATLNIVCESLSMREFLGPKKYERFSSQPPHKAVTSLS